MKTKAQRRRCRRQRRLAPSISDFKYFRPKMLQKAADIILAFFLALACLAFPAPPAGTSSSRCSACVFCVPTCGKFGKLISSGGLQNFGPNLQNFLTRRKHRKQRRRQRSHLYAFTVFRPVCTKFKWQSMTPRLLLSLLSRPTALLPFPVCLCAVWLLTFQLAFFFFFAPFCLLLRPFY